MPNGVRASASHPAIATISATTSGAGETYVQFTSGSALSGSLIEDMPCSGDDIGHPARGSHRA